jgi:phosphonatase-like hydrolase
LTAAPGSPRTGLVIFDLGGTTIVDDGAINGIFVEVAAEHRLPTDERSIEAVDGLAKKEAFLELAIKVHPDWPEAAETLASEASEVYETRLEDHYQREPIQLVQGTAEAIRYLRQRGIQVAITTGFWRKLLDLILGKVALDGMLDSSVATDEITRGKPAPYMIFRAMEECRVMSVRHVVVVGDTPLDLLAGSNAGCGTVIGVLTGTHTRAALERQPHNYIIDSSARVKELFETGRVR